MSCNECAAYVGTPNMRKLTSAMKIPQFGVANIADAATCKHDLRSDDT